MGGCRCSFRNCVSATKTHHDYHFFHYPVKQRERCIEWIKQAQKPQFLNLPDDQLRNKVVCELHFSLDQFTNVEKKRLVRSAVPWILGYVEEPQEDVKVVPASADGTIFTLDPDSLHSNDSFIPRYQYSNGTLVLVNDSEDTNGTSQMESNDASLVLSEGIEGNYMIIDPNQMSATNLLQNNQIMKNEVSRFNLKQNEDSQIYFTQADQQNVHLIYEEEEPVRNGHEELKSDSQNIRMIYEDEEPESNDQQARYDVEGQVQIQNDVSEMAPQVAVASEVNNPVEQSENLTDATSKPKRKRKTLVQIVREHSCAIRNLQRNQLNVHRSVARKLRRTPPSFRSLLNILTKGKDPTYSDKELELLSLLYKSGDLYKTLKEKYKWNLPDLAESGRGGKQPSKATEK